ncbi:MAG: ABC transporter permease [Salinarimonas sp.]
MVATTIRNLSGFSLSWLLVVAGGFALLRLMPGDPVIIFLDASGLGVDGAVLERMRAAWGLDAPLFVQFLDWLARFISGDWGISYATGRPVLPEIAGRLPWSVTIGAGGLGLAVIVGFRLGFAAAARPGGVADRLSRLLAIGAQALPAFAVGFVLLWLLAIEFRLVRPLSGGVAERLFLPILLVALFSIGSVARVTRVAFCEIRDRPYFTTALAKGYSRRVALWRQGRRHAALTLLAVIMPEAAWIIGGTAIAEIVFSVPGLSEYVVRAVAARDYAVLQAFIAIVALWLLLVQRAAALARRSLDPRLADQLTWRDA